MREKIDWAHRQAAVARKKAREAAEQRMKDEWAQVALMWEELADAYRSLQEMGKPA